MLCCAAVRQPPGTPAATALRPQGTSDPVKAFDRAANLEQTQIISYRVDPTEKWWVAGLAAGSGWRCPTSTAGLLLSNVRALSAASPRAACCCRARCR